MIIKNKRIKFNLAGILLIVVGLALFGIGLHLGLFTYTVDRLWNLSAKTYCTNGHADTWIVSKNIKYCSKCGAETGYLKQLSCTNCGKYVSNKSTARYCKYCGKEFPYCEEFIKPPVSDSSLVLYWLTVIFILFWILPACLAHDIVIVRNRVEGIAVYDSDNGADGN